MTEKTSDTKSSESIDQNNVVLRDTTSNGFHVRFLELGNDEYDSLTRLVKITVPPIEHFDQYTRADSCVIFSLKNGGVDSLCNRNDGEYYETYVIKGRWKDSELILINFANWEEHHDFLLDLRDGTYYILTPDYEVTPDKKFIFATVDIMNNPIYPGSMTLLQISNDKITPILQQEMEQTSITDVFWVSNTQCILTAGFLDYGADKMTNIKKYLMVVEPDESRNQ